MKFATLFVCLLGCALLCPSPIYSEERNTEQQQVERSGWVYVISNQKSFGKDIYKIGMTQRKNPATRIKELSDASVPFDFELNILVETQNPKKLESYLHKQLNQYRMNPRKEFFKVTLKTIKDTIDQYNNLDSLN